MTLPSCCLCNSRPNKPPHKQDGPWSFLVVTCAFIQSWLFIGTARTYGVYLPVLMKEFNEGRDKIALVSSLADGLGFLMTVIVAWLNSSIDSRILNGVGHLSLVISFTVSSFIHRVELLYLTYSIFNAIGMGFVLSTNVLVIVKYFRKHRSLAQGLNSSGGALGVMTVPNISQYLLDSVGWRNAFRLQGAAVVISSLLCLMYSPNVENERHDNQGATEKSKEDGVVNEGANEDHEESAGFNISGCGHQNQKNDIVQQSEHIQNQSKDKEVNGQEEKHQETHEIISEDGRQRRKKGDIEENATQLEEHTGENINAEDPCKDPKVLSLRAMFDLSVWRVPMYTVVVISNCLASFSLFSAPGHLVKFSEEVGLSATSASSLYIFLGLASLIARIVAGKLCDISCIKPNMVNMVSELIAAIATFLLTLSTTYVHLAILVFMYGFADGMFRTSMIVLLTTTVERSKSGSAYGQGYSITAPFFAAGPAITGLLADDFGEYTKAFYVNGCVLVASAAVHLIPILFRCRQTSNSFTLDHIEMSPVQDNCNANDNQVAVQTSKANPSFIED